MLASLLSMRVSLSVAIVCIDYSASDAMCQCVFQLLVTALALSRLDYCNAVLVAWPGRHDLTSVMSSKCCSTARLYSMRRSEHSHDRRVDQSWLTERIVFKPAVNVDCSRHCLVLPDIAVHPCHWYVNSSTTRPTNSPCPHRLSTVGLRPFPHYRRPYLDGLPFSSSLTVFRQRQSINQSTSLVDKIHTTRKTIRLFTVAH